MQTARWAYRCGCPSRRPPAPSRHCTKVRVPPHRALMVCSIVNNDRQINGTAIITNPPPSPNHPLRHARIRTSSAPACAPVPSRSLPLVPPRPLSRRPNAISSPRAAAPPNSEASTFPTIFVPTCPPRSCSCLVCPLFYRERVTRHWMKWPLLPSPVDVMADRSGSAVCWALNASATDV